MNNFDKENILQIFLEIEKPSAEIQQKKKMAEN